MAVTSGMFPIPFSTFQDSDKKGKQEDNKRQDRLYDVQEKIMDTVKETGGQTVDFLSRIFDRENEQSIPSGLIRFRNKIMQTQFKGIVQNRYYEASLKGLEAIKNSLGQGLIDLIVGLLAFALFDPDGALLSSLIMLFANLLTMIIQIVAQLFPKILIILIRIVPVLIQAIEQVIGAVIQLLPVIIDTVIKLIPIIFDSLKQLIPAILQGLSIIITTILQALGDQFPALQGVVNLLVSAIQTLVSWMTPDVVGLIIKWAAAIAGVIIAIQVIIAVIGTVSAIITAVTTVMGIFGTIMGVVEAIMGGASLAAALLSGGLGILSGIVSAASLAFEILGVVIAIVTSPIGLIVLAVLALIAVGYLVYKYWDQIKKFVLDLWDSLGPVMRAIIVILFLPIVLIGVLAYSIYKHWDEIVSYLLVGWNWLKGFLILLFQSLISPWVMVWGYMKKFGKVFYKILLSIAEGIFMVHVNVGNAILNWLTSWIEKIKNFFSVSDMITSIKNAISKAFDDIPGLKKIRDFFDELFTWMSNTTLGKMILGNKPENAMEGLVEATKKASLNISPEKEAELISREIITKAPLTATEVAKQVGRNEKDQSVQALVDVLNKYAEAIQKDDSKVKSAEDVTKYLKTADLTNSQVKDALLKMSKSADKLSSSSSNPIQPTRTGTDGVRPTPPAR